MTGPALDLITILALLAVQIADVWTTNRILERGGRELNPFIRWIMDKTGDQWPFFKVTAALALAAAIWLYGEFWTVWLITAPTALIALNNWRVLRGMQ